MKAVSEALYIFVQTELTLSDFVRSIEPVLGITFDQFVFENGNELYEFRDHRFGVTITHAYDFESDEDLELGDYQYYIAIWLVKSPNWQENEKALGTFARTIFERLRSINRYRLLFVDDLQIKLDEAAPEEP